MLRKNAQRAAAFTLQSISSIMPPCWEAANATPSATGCAGGAGGSSEVGAGTWTGAGAAAATAIGTACAVTHVPVPVAA